MVANCKLTVLILAINVVFFPANGNIVSLRIEGREKVCFGYDFEENSGEVNVDLQVSSGGDTDINWKLLDPKGNELIREDHKNTANHDFVLNVGGEYSVCFDNTFSSDHKIITLIVDQDSSYDEQSIIESFSLNQAKINAPPGFFNKSENLRKNAEKLLHFHGIYSARQKRHYFLVDSNLSRVNGFSLLSCAVMIAVGILQVVIVKSLFEDGSNKKFKLFT